LLLAFAGAGAGLWAYVWLIRYSEAIGYAKPPNRAVPEQARHPELYEDDKEDA
jgi:hypothetical protein